MNIKKIIKEMTLEEKVGLCSGDDFWFTKAVERLSIPQVMFSDGPHGLRKQDLEADHLGINNSIQAVCFPTGCTVASSFDRDLVYEMGELLGNECQAEDVAVILGPAVNIKRSPLCGRNFEYFSEDPLLTSTIAASQIKGVQSKGIGTSIKHFLANNQEYRRMTSNSIVDERTLREIYLASFETAIKESKPWTVMCSYNQINGIYASESYHFLTEILRDEWEFDGFVMSDWGAVNDRDKGIEAGLDLEMPSSGGINDKLALEAVNNGTLDIEALDKSVSRILGIIDKYTKNRIKTAVFDRDADHRKARKIAGESMVLLKNDGVLPLSKEKKIAFIGEFAEKPRFQGGGSSHINAHKVSDALSSVKKIKNIDVAYAKGYDLEKDETNTEMIEEALKISVQSDVVVIFAGLPDLYESEGYDRSHMKLPDSHNQLIEAISSKHGTVVIVLHNGSPVEMPWVSKVKGVLEAYLSGQAVGEAVTDILFGDVNPSGKLAETFPIKLEDNPSYLYYFGEKDTVEYREGVFVGYRYYDSKNMDVLFPFGYGLSYTTFEFSDIKLSSDELNDNYELKVSVTITNTGNVFGKEVIQLYVTPSDKGTAIRPIQELKAYEKVDLNPGESKIVEFKLNKRAFAYYNTEIKDWFVESGMYGIRLGNSSRDICIEEKVEVNSSEKIPIKYHLNSTIGDLMADEKSSAIIKPFRDKVFKAFGGDDSTKEEEPSKETITEKMKDSMLAALPLRRLVSFTTMELEYSDLVELVEQLNSNK